jgi:hypothetical protein
MDLLHSLPYADQLELVAHIETPEKVSAWLENKASKHPRVGDLVKEIEDAPLLELDVKLLVDPSLLLEYQADSLAEIVRD